METWAKHLVSPKILWITLSLISWALKGGKSCNSWQDWVCVRKSFYACVHGCICAFLIFCWKSFLVPFALLTLLFGGVCVYSVRLDSSGIYVYSMCFCYYKGIFHSVMLINLISKSRNMKQELKKQTFTAAGCAPAYFQPIFFFPSSAFFFIQQ